MPAKTVKTHPPTPISSTQGTNVPDVDMPGVNAGKPVLRPMEDQKNPSKPSNKKALYGLIAVVVILAGIASGYFMAAGQRGGGSLIGGEKLQESVSSDEITVGTKVGVADESTFRDSAEGTLAKGGFEGEGSHHLVRPGGDSQTVYISSVIIDLDQYIDRKVKVWGETINSQKTGWLMDVGKLEVLE